MSHAPRIDPGSPRPNDHDRERALVDSVLSGSLLAWHEFIDRYSGLVLGVVRRQLFREDEDDTRGVYVDILEALYNGSLASFEGRSTLATWLIVFSRNRARDLLRRRHGRNRPPRWLDRLDDFHRELIRLHFVERLPLEAVIHQVCLAGHDATRTEVLDALLEVSDTVPERYLTQVGAGPLRHEDLEACSPALMRRLLRLSDEAGEREYAPDSRLVAADEEAKLDRLRAATARLSRRERQVLRMRFEQGWTAPRIARELRMDGPRKVYTIIERSLAKLRKSIEFGGGGS